MAADLELNLPSDTSAPGVARAAAKRHLAGKVSLRRLSDLSLVISELVSNAFEHGLGQVVLRLQFDEGTVRGEVIDQITLTESLKGRSELEAVGGSAYLAELV